MSKLIDCEKIAEEIAFKHDLALTALDRTILEVAVLKGAMAMLDNEKQVMKELREKLNLMSDKPKVNWINKIFKRKKNAKER